MDTKTKVTYKVQYLTLTGKWADISYEIDDIRTAIDIYQREVELRSDTSFRVTQTKTITETKIIEVKNE